MQVGDANFPQEPDFNRIKF